MAHMFVVKGELCSLNQYTNTNRGNRYAGNTIKQESTNRCLIASVNALRGWSEKPNAEGLFDLVLNWNVKNNMKDSDNIFFAVKFILDGMVKAKMITNDNRRHIRNISHAIYTNKERQYVSIELKEVKGYK